MELSILGIIGVLFYAGLVFLTPSPPVLKLVAGVAADVWMP